MDTLLGDISANINATHPAIKFKQEDDEEEEKLEVLDAIGQWKMGPCHYLVYCKLTHTDHCLQYSSNQPLQHKLGVIKMPVHQSSTVSADNMEQLWETHHLKKVLSISGYTKKSWRSPAAACSWASPSSPALSESQERELFHAVCGLVLDQIDGLF